MAAARTQPLGQPSESLCRSQHRTPWMEPGIRTTVSSLPPRLVLLRRRGLLQRQLLALQRLYGLLVNAHRRHRHGRCTLGMAVRRRCTTTHRRGIQTQTPTAVDRVDSMAMAVIALVATTAVHVFVAVLDPRTVGVGGGSDAVAALRWTAEAVAAPSTAATAALVVVVVLEVVVVVVVVIATATAESRRGLKHQRCPAIPTQPSTFWRRRSSGD
jgi:hypothetical protein